MHNLWQCKQTTEYKVESSTVVSERINLCMLCLPKCLVFLPERIFYRFTVWPVFTASPESNRHAQKWLCFNPFITENMWEGVFNFLGE